MEFITLKNIEKTYKDGNNPVRAVKNINIKISQGDFVAVMGPSGSGKSTLLSVLGAITSPNNGDVIIDDINIFSLSDKIRADFRREYLGFVFQAYFLVPYLNA
ncbi:MAG: ATP-binding cassette domain-containing protein, partial [Actinomycetia bacterium]|nr:ATP-binding cassette domain-containing protein [Actinomycetes bacterium]